MFAKNCDQKFKSVSVKTPIGDITLTVCGNGLHGVSREFTSGLSSEPSLLIKVQIKDNEFDSKEKLINDSIKWLTNYFEGQHNGVDFPQLCASITRSEFNLKVWSTLMKGTKFGQTISYSDLAASVGKPNASRAVGSAMRSNPFILIVPCHRVVKKDGTIGNYSAGNSLKEWLISFEKEFSQK